MIVEKSVVKKNNTSIYPIRGKSPNPLQLQGIFGFLGETKTFNPMKKLFSITALLLFLSTVAVYSQSLDQGKISAIEELISKQMLKFDYELDKAWVSPVVWNQYNVDGKENFTLFCARYIRHRQKSTVKPSVDLYDYQSGKKIAEYSILWGFSIED